MIKKVTSRFSVSAQVNPGDAVLAAAQGIKTIICNRPDHESEDQPDAQAISDAAADVNIQFVHIPVVPGAITDEQISEFSDTYKNAQGPVLAYCRSGMRSISLWALSEAASLDVNTIMDTAKQAGYDLAGLRSRLIARAES